MSYCLDRGEFLSTVLTVTREFSPRRFAELGRVTGVFESERHRLVAVVSEFDLFYVPGRAVYGGHRLRHRVVLYDLDSGGAVDHFDRASFPINDVAFHPDRSLVALATGTYDGGYMFEGELICWDREAKRSWTVFAEDREVSRCRFEDDGRLVVAVRPATEEDVDEGDDPFATYWHGSVEDLRGYEDLRLRRREADPRLAQLQKGSLRDTGFVEETPKEHPLLMEYEPRHRVWDVLRSANVVYACHDRCVVEGWSSEDGSRALHVTTVDEAKAPSPLATLRETLGIQIIGCEGEVLVNASTATSTSDFVRRSGLYKVEVGTVRLLHQFPYSVLMSADRRGRILARDVREHGRRGGADYLLSSGGKILEERDLGHYDSFNHYLRIDGASSLYFLRGNPRDQHKCKELVEIVAGGAECPILKWDDQGRHLLCGNALEVEGGFIRAIEVYSPDPRSSKTGIERLSRAGEVEWHHGTSACVTALLDLGRRGVLFSLTSGNVGLLDPGTGRAYFDEPLMIDGFPTVVMSMASHDDEIYLGCIDGRVLEARVFDA